MTDRPILFSTPMVQALHAGRKTQTRRVLKPQPEMLEAGDCIFHGHRGPVDYLMREIAPQFWARVKVGDRLWVREAWRTLQKWDDLKPSQIADDVDKVKYEAGPDRNKLWAWGRFRPGMFMPRWASRAFVTVTDVRGQRLQEIGGADAIAEGLEPINICGAGWHWKHYGEHRMA